MRSYFLFLLFVIPFVLKAQIVDEVIQIDTTTETIKVIYKPIESSTYYFKKTAVFADDTSQVAIEKSFTNYGQNGLYKVYYPSGRLKIKTVFANNKINGEWTYYDPNGIIIIKGIYKDGVKHGYWAYKSLRIYGRYKNGVKNRKWKRFDQSEKKYLSHYKKGKLTGGEGFGDEKAVILYDTIKAEDPIVKNNGKKPIAKEYQQAISFLSENVVFKKALKEHFGGSMAEIRAMKSHFKKNKFQFLLSPTIINMDISKFISDSKEDKIVVAKIDSLLKRDSDGLKSIFNEKGELSKNEDLVDYSTHNQSPMTVYFSEINEHLLRIDVVNFKEFSEDTFSYTRYQEIPQNQKFQILLYFDDEGVLKGAEYEKP